MSKRRPSEEELVSSKKSAMETERGKKEYTPDELKLLSESDELKLLSELDELPPTNVSLAELALLEAELLNETPLQRQESIQRIVSIQSEEDEQIPQVPIPQVPIPNTVRTNNIFNIVSARGIIGLNDITQTGESFYKIDYIDKLNSKLASSKNALPYIIKVPVNEDGISSFGLYINFEVWNNSNTRLLLKIHISFHSPYGNFPGGKIHLKIFDSNNIPKGVYNFGDLVCNFDSMKPIDHTNFSAKLENFNLANLNPFGQPPDKLDKIIDNIIQSVNEVTLKNFCNDANILRSGHLDAMFIQGNQAERQSSGPPAQDRLQQKYLKYKKKYLDLKNLMKNLKI